MLGAVATMADALGAWVSEQLHRIAGFSSKSTTAYVASLAASATSEAQLRELLAECDVRDDGFCADLWRRGAARRAASAAGAAGRKNLQQGHQHYRFQAKPKRKNQRPIMKTTALKQMKTMTTMMTRTSKKIICH